MQCQLCKHSGNPTVHTYLAGTTYSSSRGGCLPCIDTSFSFNQNRSMHQAILIDLGHSSRRLPGVHATFALHLNGTMDQFISSGLRRFLEGLPCVHSAFALHLNGTMDQTILARSNCPGRRLPSVNATLTDDMHGFVDLNRIVGRSHPQENLRADLGGTARSTWA